MSTFDDMAERLTTTASKTPGSLAMDNLAAVAVEIDRMREDEIEVMPNRFFPTLASGEDLTLAAANFGVNRREATYASVVLTITGEEGAEVSLGTCAQAGDIIFAAIEEATFNAAGTKDVEFEAVDAGASGNVAAGTINTFVSVYAGLTAVTNKAAAEGGADEEDDEALLERVRIKWATPSTGGNLGDYQRWAIDVAGVADVKAFNPSAGNVKVYIVGVGNTQASEELVQEVADNIEANRPVGANVTVLSGEPVTINLTVNVKLQTGYAASSVKALIEEAMQDWLETLTFNTNSVNYVKAATLLFVDGVSEVVSYEINGGTSSIALGDTQFPVLGTVTVNAA